MTRLDFITSLCRGNRRPLTLEEIELNKATARQWRRDNPEFFATDPRTLRHGVRRARPVQ